MSGRAMDLTGQVFGKLTAVEKVGVKNGRAQWRCKCECGNEHIGLWLTQSLLRRLNGGRDGNVHRTNSDSCTGSGVHLFPILQGLRWLPLKN